MEKSVRYQTGGNMEQKKTKSIQDWLPIQQVQKAGTILLKNHHMVKILKISSINFSLKTEFEKETILNSYKILLKTCNFPFQIVIHSTKEDLTNQEKEIHRLNEEENEKNKKIAEDYLRYLKQLNNSKKSSRKNFYIIIQSEIANLEMQEDELKEKYLKIKECLSRCGNVVYEVNEKKETIEVLQSFFHARSFSYDKG